MGLAIYIYIYIYIIGVPFPGPRARRQQIPRGVPGAKSDFSWCPVSGAFSKGFWRLQRRVLGSLLEGSGIFFLLSDQESVRNVKKCSFGVFRGAKSRGLLLQKHANRTVHPSKIEGVRSRVYVLLYVSQGHAFWSSNACP